MVKNLLKLGEQCRTFIEQRSETWSESIKESVRAISQGEEDARSPFLGVLSSYYANRALVGLKEYKTEEIDWYCLGLSFEYLRLSLIYLNSGVKKPSSVDIANCLSLCLYGRIASRPDMCDLALRKLPTNMKDYDKQSGRIKFSDAFILASSSSPSDVHAGYYGVLIQNFSGANIPFYEVVNDHVCACKSTASNRPVFNLAGSVLPLDIIFCSQSDELLAVNPLPEFSNRIKALGYCDDGLIGALDISS